MHFTKIFCLATLVAACLLVQPSTATSAGLETITAGHEYPVVCRHVDYRFHHQRRDFCCTCEPPIKTVIMVKDPCTCCLVPVEVCLPACCVKPPAVHCRKALFGRSISTYDYCCGFKIKVVIDKCGDLTVHYYGKV